MSEKKEYTKPEIKTEEFDEALLHDQAVCDGTTGGPDNKKASGMDGCTTRLT